MLSYSNFCNNSFLCGKAVVINSLKFSLSDLSTDLLVTIATVIAHYVCFSVVIYVYFYYATVSRFSSFARAHRIKIMRAKSPGQTKTNTNGGYLAAVCVWALQSSKGKAKTKQNKIEYGKRKQSEMPTNCANCCFCVAYHLPTYIAFHFIYFCSSFVVFRCCCCQDAQ